MPVAPRKRVAVPTQERFNKLGRGERLRHTTQFLAIRRRGAWARGPLLSLGVLPSRRRTSRFGIRIQRGLKGSVARNRAKRLLREAYRTHKHELAGGQDLLAVIHAIHGLSLSVVERELLKQCHRLRLVRP